MKKTTINTTNTTNAISNATSTVKIFKVLRYTITSTYDGSKGTGIIVLYSNGSVYCETQYGFTCSNCSLLETINRCFNSGDKFTNSDLAALFNGGKLSSCDNNFATEIVDISHLPLTGDEEYYAYNMKRKLSQK